MIFMTMGSKLACTSRWSTCIAQPVRGTIRMDSCALGAMLCAYHALRNTRRLVSVHVQMVKATSCQSPEQSPSSS